jgi:autotransporter-associated beta strand protein
VAGQGAIINTRAEQQSAIRLLTLAGDTYVTSDFRWDVRGAGGNGSFSGLLDLNGYTLSRAGTNRIAIVDAVATNAGNIVIIEGGMSLARSYIEGPGYIDVGTNFVWIEASTVGRISKPLIFEGGRLQCSGGDFVLDSYVTNVSGLTLDNSSALTISNTISGGGWLDKIAAGVLRLEAANTYAGDTTINAGTLALGTNGTIGSGATITLAAGATFDVTAKGGFTVASGKTFIGGGTVNGGFTVANGATLQVGTLASTGTLTVLNGNAALGGNTFMKVNATTKATDSISTTNAINLGGTLTVDNLGGTFADGDTFKLFNAPVLNGTFSQTLLPPLGPGQIWLNNLSVDGTIAVGDLILVTTELPGGFWQFSWASKLNGLVKVQAQTNALNVGISTNWSDYPNGDFNGVLHTPSTSNPSVFFRLITQ